MHDEFETAACFHCTVNSITHPKSHLIYSKTGRFTNSLVHLVNYCTHSKQREAFLIITPFIIIFMAFT